VGRAVCDTPTHRDDAAMNVSPMMWW